MAKISYQKWRGATLTILDHEVDRIVNRVLDLLARDQARGTELSVTYTISDLRESVYPIFPTLRVDAEGILERMGFKIIPGKRSGTYQVSL